MKNTERQKKVEKFLSELNTEIDVLNYVDVDEVNSFDDIVEQLQDSGGFDIDIIYYSNAIKFLAENDPSLRDSMEIAGEYGFELCDINSELLASLLASGMAVDEFFKIEDEINQFFEEL